MDGCLDRRGVLIVRPFPTYRYLALEGGWPGVHWEGLVLGAAGELELAPVPDLSTPVGTPLAPVAGLQGPVGVAADRNGDIYYVDAATHRILRLNACDDRVEALACLAKSGGGPGQLFQPRGLVLGPHRTLYVADSGNRRIQILDLNTQQVVGVWGPLFADEDDDRFGFRQPWDLAVDASHFVYVADPGALDDHGRRGGGGLRRFDPSGLEDLEFRHQLAQSQQAPQAPIGVAVALTPGAPRSAERVLVLDSAPAQLLVFTPEGHYDADATDRWAAVAGAAPDAIAFHGHTLYVAVAGGRVMAFDEHGAVLGASRQSVGAVAGLAVDCHGRLLAHPGSDGHIRRALGGPSHVEVGHWVTDAIRGRLEKTRWQRLLLDADLPPGAHVRMFTHVSMSPATPALALPFNPANGVIADQVVRPDTLADAPLDQWRAAPADALDILALHQPGEYLRIAALIYGDGRATPTVRQLRIENDREGALAELPMFYRRDAEARPFLERALAVFESSHRSERDAIASLPRLFDADAAPDPRIELPTWLDSLGRWVDARPAEEWSEEQRRRRVARAYRDHARRGTLDSMRELVRLYAGATVFIEDAGSAPDLWQLGAGALGFETALAPEPAQGAVVGTTAVMNHSRIAREEELGRPAWEGAAHRFIVQVVTAGAPPDALDRVRTVLDREKPAHTVYELCPIDARMRVGFQARLGVDSIVGGPPPPTRLGDAALGNGMQLGGRDTEALGQTFLTS
jgi:phage tail-like protein